MTVTKLRKHLEMLESQGLGNHQAVISQPENPEKSFLTTIEGSKKTTWKPNMGKVEQECVILHL